MQSRCPEDLLCIQPDRRESKHDYISPQEKQLFISHQKILDWVKNLSRSYDVGIAVMNTNTGNNSMNYDVIYDDEMVISLNNFVGLYTWS